MFLAEKYRCWKTMHFFFCRIQSFMDKRAMDILICPVSAYLGLNTRQKEITTMIKLQSNAGSDRTFKKEKVFDLDLEES